MDSLLLQSEHTIPDGNEASVESSTKSSDAGSPIVDQGLASTAGQSWSSEFQERQQSSERGDPHGPAGSGTEADDVVS